ncbi:MAG: glycosyltransferase, partial [Zetaproteobacteria bacterium]|nr:glycosyltransferase [Zetaproteobacteria bacterium]
MRILMIGSIWPELHSSGACLRLLGLLGAWVEHGDELHFASAASVGDRAFDFAKLGVQTHAIQVNDDRFNQWIADLNPDVVLFDRFMMEEQFGWRVEKFCPSA